MGDTKHDNEIDRAEPAADPRSDLEQMVEARADALEAGGAADSSPLEPTGMPDGVGGTGGTVKNQDHDAQ